MENMSPAVKWLSLILAVMVFGGVGFGLGQYYVKSKSQPTTTTVEETSSTISTTEPTTDETTSDWVTYTNKEVGYSLKHPADWKIKETSAKSEVTNQDVKYITISSPDNNYALTWGLAKKDASFNTTDRTGVGAGDMTAQDDLTVTILGAKVTPEALVFEGKNKEYFWPNQKDQAAKCSCSWTISFSPTSSGGLDAVGPKGQKDDLPIVNKILSSVKWLNQ